MSVSGAHEIFITKFLEARAGAWSEQRKTEKAFMGLSIERKVGVVGKGTVSLLCPEESCSFGESP